jgi:hypothetical protein
MEMEASLHLAVLSSQFSHNTQQWLFSQKLEARSQQQVAAVLLQLVACGLQLF